MGQAPALLQLTFQSRTHQAFRWMVILSCLLHVAVFVLLTLKKLDGEGGKRVAFMDLAMIQPSVNPAMLSAPVSKPLTPPAVTAPAPVPEPTVPAPSEMSKMEDKLEQTLQAPDNPAALQQVSVGLGATRGYFRSLGEGETLREDVQAYYFELLRSINEKWWLDKNIDRTGIREVVINIIITRDGTIVRKELMRGSGNMAYDRAVLKALEGTGPLPPVPDSYQGQYFLAPIRLVAPLNLLAS